MSRSIKIKNLGILLTKTNIFLKNLKLKNKKFKISYKKLNFFLKNLIIYKINLIIFKNRIRAKARSLKIRCVLPYPQRVWNILNDHPLGWDFYLKKIKEL